MSVHLQSHYVTANDLLTGEVVFLAADGTWVPELSGAELVTDPEEGAARVAFAEADARHVVGPYLAVAADGPAPAPAHFRERFRATGPSNYAHGKQERRVHV